MAISSQILRCFTPLSSSSTFSSDYQCRAASLRITRCSRSASVQEVLPSETKPPPPPPPPPPSTDEANSMGASCSGIQVPRERYISISKSELLDAIIYAMFPSQEEARQFFSLSQLLDSIIHAEHKTVLEEMRSDFDCTLSTKNKAAINADDYPDAFTNSSLESDGIDKEQEDDTGSKISLPFGFTMDLNLLFNISSKTSKRNPIKNSRVAIPGRFQRAFIRLLNNAEFEELSPRDLMLTSALNTDYLLTLPIYVDWKRASESNAIIFRRGYATERQKGLLIAEKLDYLQSTLLQNIFFFIAKPLGRLGVWLDEVFKSIFQKQETEVLVNKFKLSLEEFSLSLNPRSYDEKIFDDLKGVEILSSDLPIWVAAQKAVTRYEGILSKVGPRERLLRKFFTWVGLLPSTPEKAFDLHLDSNSSEFNSSPSFLPRISLSDIWKPASPKFCGNDFRKMLKNGISILFSQSIIQDD